MTEGTALITVTGEDAALALLEWLVMRLADPERLRAALIGTARYEDRRTARFRRR